MDINDATEEAYKNGYEDGKRDAVKHGMFEFACVHNGKKFYKCTQCHHAFPFANVNYCPNCGAKMDGDGNA